MSTAPATDAPPGAFARIARNAASILAGTAAGEVLTTYALGLAALSLGSAGFGTLQTARAFAEPFQSLATFGLGSVAITMAARRGGLDGALRGTVFAMTAAWSVVAVTLSLVLAAVTGRGGPLPLVGLASVGIALIPLSAAASLPFQHHQSMHRLLALPFAISVLRLGTAYLAYYLLRTPVGFQASATFTGVVAALATLALSGRFYGFGFSFDKTLARELLVLAWPAAALEFIVMAYMRGGYVLLHRAGPRVQGEYAAADQLVRPVLTLAAALVVSSLPTVAKMATEGSASALYGSYRKTLWRAAVLLVPIGLLAGTIAPWLLRNVAPDYVGATGPFRILLVGTLFMCLSQVSSTFILAMGRFRLIMVVASVNFVVYLGLAVALIPRFQASGAAAATSIMEAVNSILQIVIVFRLLGKSPPDAPVSPASPSPEEPLATPSAPRS